MIRSNEIECELRNANVTTVVSDFYRYTVLVETLNVINVVVMCIADQEFISTNVSTTTTAVYAVQCRTNNPTKLTSLQFSPTIQQFVFGKEGINTDYSYRQTALTLLVQDSY